MTEFLPGGRRRIDRVLAPAFIEDVEGLDLQELRVRRADADQEEVDLSYARRLLQGRLDILRAEQASRRGDGPFSQQPRTDVEIVAALSRILADEQRQTRGLGRHVTGSAPSRVGEHRREAERAVADVGGSDLAALTQVQLAEAISHLSDIEARVSRSRRQVQAVVDLLTEEIARRYQAGEVGVGAR
ncbi:MAG: RsiG family protein [Kineosporiaceae bacterium]